MSDIRFEDFQDCIICHKKGKHIYDKIPDRLFGVGGEFSLDRCSVCGLLWLNPRPVVEDMGKCYKNYYTHQKTVDGQQIGVNNPNSNFRRPFSKLRDALRYSILCGHYGYKFLHKDHKFCFLGPILSKIPVLKLRATYDWGALFPHFIPDGLLMDIGCGNGNYLKNMKEMGWNVLGIEPDAASANLAKTSGLNIFNGTLEEANLPDSYADQITMIHVIEHLPDPVSAIKECYRILKPAGRLLIRTPNAESLAHVIFKNNCFHLDPPRHLFVFSCKSMYGLFKNFNFRKFYIKTLSRSAEGIYDNSARIKKEGKINIKNLSPQRGRNLFAFVELLGCLPGGKWGEEIEILAVK